VTQVELSVVAALMVPTFAGGAPMQAHNLEISRREGIQVKLYSDAFVSQYSGNRCGGHQEPAEDSALIADPQHYREPPVQ
jgi:hypothetical protein